MKRALLALLILLGGCSSSTDDESEASPVALVSVARVSTGVVPRSVVVFGAADAGASGIRNIAAPVEATVASINAPVGTRVGAGQVIARLNPSPSIQLDISKALAEARTANDAYARARRLRADGLNSDADVESARAAAATASATLSSLTRRTRDVTLVAPTAGTVSSVSFGPGTLVSSGATVATITAGQGIRGRFGIDPAMARHVVPGNFVRVAPTAGGPGFSVPISSVDPGVDPQTRLASVYVTLPPRARLGAGEPLRGEIVMNPGQNGIAVPYSAILDDGGQPFVYLVQKGIAHRRDVQVGTADGKVAAILSGLGPGEIVVTQGGTALEDGMKVRTR